MEDRHARFPHVLQDLLVRLQPGGRLPACGGLALQGRRQAGLVGASLREAALGLSRTEILSGANADGAAGLKAIADAGGMTVVQSLESAEMIAMPAAAKATAAASVVRDILVVMEAISWE